MREIARYLVVLVVWSFGVSTAWAHSVSTAYLTVSKTESSDPSGLSLDVSLSLAVRDIEYVIGVDADRNGAVTWGELKAAVPQIDAYVAEHLKIRAGADYECPLGAGAPLVDHLTDGGYLVLRYKAICAGAPSSSVSLEYSLLLAENSQHRAFLKFGTGAALPVVLNDQNRAASTDIAAAQNSATGWNALGQFVTEGIRHIWVGYDHILFLVALLLPAVYRREGRGFAPAESFPPVIIDVVKVVTAFTVAHTITLTLTTFTVISLPSRLVESVVAASVVVAALNNITPFVRENRWMMAFLFGLVHGIGFASVIGDLGLQGSALIVPLLGFNLGVEIGQLVIVTGFLPFAFVTRESKFYKHGVLQVGSGIIAVLALVWFTERVFNITLVG